MIEPKDGEWWMVELASGDKRVMRYWLRCGGSDAVWNVFKDESDSFIRAHSSVKPLHKMVKAEEPKPRTKVVYEHLTQSDASVWDLREMLENGELFAKRSDNTYDLYSGNAECYMIRHFIEYGVYRKVEKEIDWKDEVKSYIESVEYLSKHDELRSVYNGDEAEDDEAWDAEFIGMCHLLVSLTDKPE